MKYFKLSLSIIVILSFILSGISFGNFQVQQQDDHERETALQNDEPGYSYEEALRLLQDGGTEQAASMLETVIRNEPDNLSAHIHLVRAYLTLGDYERGEEVITAALELEPGNADVYYLQGRIYHSAGRYDEAIQTYRRSIELNNNNAFAMNNLGYAYIQMNQYEDAIPVLEEAINQRSDVAFFYNNLGVAYIKTGRLDAAAEAFRMALGINPEYNRARENLTIVEEQLQNDEDAGISEQREIE